ncbi:MAG: hypothetical protein CMA72_07215 [Euryarchaeota archaeon]|nr:hypothetical protein [Euryarchaeota archaeon]|tara:strand:+ start:2348 stop:3619 length:1272 start_codon:yes stop_codon:yes gene_type:complete
MKNFKTEQTMEESIFLNQEFPKLVAKITSEMTTREHKKNRWRHLKKQWNNELNQLLGINPNWGVKAGNLFSFDLDARRKLVLFNYTPQAHNVLHDVAGGDGWTTSLRLMRGLVYSYETPGEVSGVKLASRSFRKFFNRDEVPSSTVDNIKDIAGSEPVMMQRKEDGAMLQYFVHGDQLCATTRGRLETPYVDAALGLLDRKSFDAAAHACSLFGYSLMTVVVELVHPISRVHVDYGNEESVYLLAAYDTGGNEIPSAVLERIVMKIHEKKNTNIILPERKMMTVTEVIDEINRRDVHNNEGWVACIGSGTNARRIKFKYVNYIGVMVKSKLSYKYLMNCMINERLDKMLITLPEEIRDVAYRMVDKIKRLSGSSSYKALYILHGDQEGGVDYFRTVCRKYYRWNKEKVIPQTSSNDYLPIYAS